MNTPDKKGGVPEGSGLDRIQIHLNGKRMMIRIHSPNFALETVFEKLRPKLIAQALQVTKDWSTAEDIVQTSLLNAYCWLNNGRIYAIKLPRGYLIVRGDGSTRSARRSRREKQEEAQRRLIERLNRLFRIEEKVTEGPATQEEKLGRAIKQWLLGGEQTDINVIEEPDAWIQKIVQNNAFKHYNEQKGYRAFLANPRHWDLAEDPRCPNPEKEFIEAERFAEVRRYVAALPTRYREIVELRYFQDQDYSFQAIAEKLDRPVHTVTSQASRALKILGEALEEQRIMKGGRLTRRRKQV